MKNQTSFRPRLCGPAAAETQTAFSGIIIPDTAEEKPEKKEQWLTVGNGTKSPR